MKFLKGKSGTVPGCWLSRRDLTTIWSLNVMSWTHYFIETTTKSHHSHYMQTRFNLNLSCKHCVLIYIDLRQIKGKLYNASSWLNEMLYTLPPGGSVTVGSSQPWSNYCIKTNLAFTIGDHYNNVSFILY